jgi:hypothetical protein
MPRLKVTLLDSLDCIDAETMDEITADGHTFASSGWFRLLASSDLSALTGGTVQLAFATVFADEVPICLCPVLRAKGEGIYFVYSLRRFYFEHWIEEAVRMDPSKADHFARLNQGVSAFRHLLEWTGSSLDECLIVTNPLSYRGHIPIAPSAPVSRLEVYSELVGFLKRLSRRCNRPLWFLGIEEDEIRLRQVLGEAKTTPSFLFYDNRINLENFESFDDYLQQFRRTTRRAFQRDMRRSAEAGVELDFISSIDEHADELTSLYQETYSKYGESFFQQPPTFWKNLKANLGTSVEAIVARRQDRMLGFSILLHNERRGELWTYRIGRTADPELADVPYYFSLSFYGPIQRAIDLGYRRIWLGPASYEAKGVRGAALVPLWNYFWFPRRIDRWCLAPYLALFGKISREEIEKSLGRPVRREEASVEKEEMATVN